MRISLSLSSRCSEIRDPFNTSERDGTGLSTKRYGRWFDVPTSKRGKKKSFVKLHAHVTTDAEMPFFLSAKVTKGYSKQLKHLIRQKSRQIAIGEMPLDSASS